MQTVCSTTAKIIMPPVRQLRRRQRQSRYLIVAVVYESRPTFSTFHYIFAVTVESMSRLQKCQQCQSWMRGLWYYDFTVGYELRSFIPKVRWYYSTWTVVSYSITLRQWWLRTSCRAPSLYDSSTNDDDDSDEDDNYDSDDFPLSRRDSSLDDIVTQGSICPASTPYDSNAADDNTSSDASSQWSMSLDLPSDAQQQQQQQPQQPTLTAYNDDDYVATAQPSSSG